MGIRDKIVDVLREYDEVRNIGGIADDLEKSLESLQRENEEQRDWIKTATVQITNAIGGGSEMFTRQGDDFRVDPAFVATLIKTSRERHAESKKASILKERELIARIEVAEADAARLRPLAAPAALLTDAEPVGFTTAEAIKRKHGQFTTADMGVLMNVNGRWANADVPLYAAAPAPSVAVKALEWELIEPEKYFRAEKDNHVYSIVESVVIRGQWHHEYNGAFYPSLDRAKAAAKADYEARVISALSAQVQDARSDDDEETYKIGVRDGYSHAVQEIDRLTGGDGEYRYCTDNAPERHTPGPYEMIQRIVDRFETLNLIGEAEKRGDFWDVPGSAQVQDVAEDAQILKAWKQLRELEGKLPHALGMIIGDALDELRPVIARIQSAAPAARLEEKP